MVFSCIFCEIEPCYISYLCDKCRALKHIKLTYKDRFDEVIQNVLVRNQEKQQYKINDEIKKDIEKKEYSLRSKEKK
tara:strand:+ start:332 stop:562 length:231 start_codon:yes stop_codon:yes gene_type:complete